MYLFQHPQQMRHLIRATAGGGRGRGRVIYYAAALLLVAVEVGERHDAEAIAKLATVLESCRAG